MTKMMPRATALLLLPALLLGACGQTKIANPPPVVAPASAALSLKVLIPTAATSSASASSLRVQLGSLDTTLALSGAACTAVAGGQECTFNLNVTPGESQTLTVSIYGAASKVLSTSTTTVSVMAGQANALSLTLTGVAASASLIATDGPGDVSSGASDSLLLDLGGSYSVGIALKDAAGQTILNPGRPTETVTSSNPAFSIKSTGVGTFSVVAPDPSGLAQTTTVTVLSADGTKLLSKVLSVPAQKISLSLANTSPVAGSSVLASAVLTSAGGKALQIAGRSVTFATTNGKVTGNTPTISTDAAGTASLSILTGTVIGSGTVSASSDGVSASRGFTSVAGVANTTTSTTLLTPDAVKVGGSSSLAVTLKDANGNPVTTTPVVTVSGGSSLGTVVRTGNVFTYPVTAAGAPETTSFTVKSGGNTVGSANLLITAYPLVISDGATALDNGAQYDFQNGSAHAFGVAETNYAGAFSVSSSNTDAATVSVSGGVLSVTPGTAAGYSTITVTDTNDQSFSFTVSVTTASFTIN
ncbi:hypothetical protein [Deinococcus sp.]|uniref:hypothetical protein n=1 Tax=Deinococcus sp. TaxID=47478 RepID=UPI003B5A47CD